MHKAWTACIPTSPQPRIGCTCRCSRIAVVVSHRGRDVICRPMRVQGALTPCAFVYSPNNFSRLAARSSAFLCCSKDCLSANDREASVAREVSSARQSCGTTTRTQRTLVPEGSSIGSAPRVATSVAAPPTDLLGRVLKASLLTFLPVPTLPC
eukprot:scaffold3581_cov417-Prasinococcus_capsulatus_cf.AAC.4